MRVSLSFIHVVLSSLLSILLIVKILQILYIILIYKKKVMLLSMGCFTTKVTLLFCFEFHVERLFSSFN